MKSVWITGASSGIGKALAIMLAKNDYHVIATARNKDVLQAMQNEYPLITPLAADLTVATDIEKINAYFKQRNRPLDIVVVNAGTCEYMDDGVLKNTIFSQVLQLNVLAAAQTIDIALPYLKQADNRGHIIGISSMSVLMPFTRAEYYGASKAALSYYLKSLALDIQKEAVDISIVYPGFVDTPLTLKNDFSMPFIISSEVAALKLMHVIKKRPKQAAFPKPLYYLLRILSICPLGATYLANKRAAA